MEFPQQRLLDHPGEGAGGEVDLRPLGGILQAGLETQVLGQLLAGSSRSRPAR